jgi:hypothetical protein
MPSWNEKAHVTPTVNVNLYTYCGDGIHCRHAGHGSVPIPCPIPRSVTFTVRLGECTCQHVREIRGGRHADDRPARPIRVACSISGKTWEGSEVDGLIEPHRLAFGIAPIDDEVIERLTEIARERWALVKALLTGGIYTLSARFPPDAVDAIHRLHMQRDAVYSALADMARAEEAAVAAQHRCDEALGVFPHIGPDHRTLPQERPSAARAAAYVERLIEQVSVLGVES